MIVKDDKYFAVVDSGQEVASYQVPANGKEWIIEGICVAAPSEKSGYVALVWDYEGDNEEYLFISYTSRKEKMNISIVGDGTKKLAIVFNNSSANDLALGGCYEAKEL